MCIPGLTVIGLVSATVMLCGKEGIGQRRVLHAVKLSCALGCLCSFSQLLHSLALFLLDCPDSDEGSVVSDQWKPFLKIAGAFQLLCTAGPTVYIFWNIAYTAYQARGVRVPNCYMVALSVVVGMFALTIIIGDVTFWESFSASRRLGGEYLMQYTLLWTMGWFTTTGYYVVMRADTQYWSTLGYDTETDQLYHNISEVSRDLSQLLSTSNPVKLRQASELYCTLHDLLRVGCGCRPLLLI